MSAEIVPYDAQQPDTIKSNKSRLSGLVELMTGMAVSSKDDLMLSVGHVL